MQQTRAFMESVVREIAEYPDQVKVEASQDELGVLLMIYVAKSDMGKIIGKQGAMIQSLRVLAKTVGMKESANVSLKVFEPERTTFQNRVSGDGSLEFQQSKY